MVNQVPRRHCSLLHGLCIVLVMVWVASTAVYADEPEVDIIAETPGMSYSRSAPTGWQTQTRKDITQDQTPRPKSLLTIRAYEGLGSLRPYFGDEPAYGIDVTAEIETCQGGSDRISALNIGGKLYEVDGDCSDNHRGTQVSVTREGRSNDEQKTGEALMRCDPATWRCRTIER